MTTLASIKRATAEAEESATDILVVDDNPRNLIAIDAALGDFVGRVVKAKSGEDALRALLRQDFALILLDVQMPGLDGFETAQLIRTRDRCKHTPIIFVTAFNQDREEVLRGYELGAVDFLFKPITPEILKAKVAAFVLLRKHVAEIARQEKLLREHERRQQHEERRLWEAEALRRAADASRQRAEELAVIVAERERAQAELTHANQELELADRRKNDFLATLAHELRTPLSPVAMGIQLLRDQLPDHTEAREVLEAMDRQSAHLVRLVDDLLEVSRISEGKIELRCAPLRLSEAIEQAVQMCSPLFHERAQTLDVKTGPAITIDGDRVRITQVIVNLLTNASRYTPLGGKVRLTCGVEGGQAVLRVIDNGRGMTPELMARIFNIFVQGEGCEDHSGLGIGLALVRQLVEQHGGTVAAESAGPGRGSTFSVRLPVPSKLPKVAPRSESMIRPRIVVPVPNELKVLLVEDSEDIRLLTELMLQRAGHEVVAVDAGVHALEVAAHSEFDLALIDIGLPAMDGAEVCRRLRQLVGSRTRLVAATGYGHLEAREQAKAASFDGYLIKPVGQQELYRELALAARHRAEQIELGAARGASKNKARS